MEFCAVLHLCDANNVTLLACFADNLPKTVREEVFRNRILSDYAGDVVKLTDSNQTWLFNMSNRAHLIWENQMSSGALTGTAADLCSIRAVAPVVKADGGAAPAAAAGVTVCCVTASGDQRAN